MEQRLYDAAAKLPATDAKLDTSQMTGKIRGTNSIRRVVITLAACAAAMCIILFGALSLASSVKEYNDAVAYFSMHNLSTDGLSRKEIKDVYKDIVNGTFTHPKTESVLNSIRSTEPQPTGETEFEQLRDQYFDEQRIHRPTEEEVLQVKERMPMKEVVELIGKPHDFGPTSGFLTLQWELADGQLFVVYVAIPSIVPDNMEFLTQIFEYGYIYNPGIWKWASPDPTAPTDSTEPTDYPDLTEPTGPTSPMVPTEPTDPSEPTGPDITEPTEPYPEPSFEDPVTLTWCIPDSNGMYSYPDLDRIIAAINEITQREINTTIRLEVIPVGEYTEAMSMKYMAAERWDICFSGMWNNYKDAVMQGAFVELPVDMLQAYAPDLMETLNPAALEALKIQGEVYALPVQWLHAQQSGLLFDTELAEKLGFDWRSVKKLEDLEPYFDMLLANGYTECISLDPWQMMNYLQSYFGFDYLHSYAIPAAVRVSDQNGTVINPYETEEFKAFARLMYKWYNKGYFTDEILSGSSKSRPVTLYPITGSGEQWQFGFAGQMVPLGQAVMTTEQVRSATLAISCYCKNPERAVAFINLLTTNEELLNLVTYGQEGIDWNWVDEDDKVIQREEYAYPGNFAFLVGNDCLDYYLDWQLVGTNETIREINADARASAILGFQYDATKMAGHMANIQAAADGLIRSIMCGMAGDPDAAIAKLNAELYAAGLQQVLDDMQSQVDAWKASQ